MDIATYTQSCKQFANDTQEWAALDQYKWYTTPGNTQGWEETPGNEHDGIPVDWAFHKSAAEIEAEAPQQFVDMLIAAVEWDLDLDYNVISKSIKVFRRL